MIERTNRSAYALQLGARNGVRMIGLPVFKEFQDGTAPLPIAITDQIASVRQNAINRICQVAHGLNDEGFIWVWGGAGTWTRRDGNSRTNTV